MTPARLYVTSLTWDLDNRLRAVRLPSGIIDGHSYDAEGLRIQKTDSTGTTNYLLNTLPALQEEREAFTDQDRARWELGYNPLPIDLLLTAYQ